MKRQNMSSIQMWITLNKTYLTSRNNSMSRKRCSRNWVQSSAIINAQDLTSYQCHCVFSYYATEIGPSSPSHQSINCIDNCKQTWSFSFYLTSLLVQRLFHLSPGPQRLPKNLLGKRIIFKVGCPSCHPIDSFKAPRGYIVTKPH